MISVDANVLVYATDLDAPKKNAVALQVIADATAAQMLALTEQSLFEFLTVSLNKRKQPLEPVVEIIDNWRAVLPVIRPDERILDEAIVLLRRYRLSYGTQECLRPAPCMVVMQC